MTITQELTLADLLEDAAGREAPLDEVRLITGWTGSDEGLQDAWDAFTDARDTRDAIHGGTADWTDVDPELTCADKWQAAVDIACELADDARCTLMLGRGDAT